MVLVPEELIRRVFKQPLQIPLFYHLAPAQTDSQERCWGVKTTEDEAAVRNSSATVMGSTVAPKFMLKSSLPVSQTVAAFGGKVKRC